MACVLLITSCGYEPIFYGIMNDVAPEEATVNGNINSIARCNINGEEYLVLTGNGALMYKSAASEKHGEWKKYSKLPFDLHHYNYFPTDEGGEGHKGQQILKVVSDKDNLYILSASFTTDTEYGIVLPKNFYLWTKPLATMLPASKEGLKEISADVKSSLFITKYDTSEGEFNTYFNLFSTNSPIPEHRKAFFRVTKTENGNTVQEYYMLDGTNNMPPQKDDSIGQTNYVATNEENTRVNSAFYLGDSLYFSDALAVTTNETKDKAATLACIGAVSKKYNPNSKLMTFDGTNLEELLSAGSTIACLAMTADSILIGKGSYNTSYTTDGGMERVLLVDGKPQNETSPFESNAKYQFTTSYIIMTILCADPSKTEAEACLYATLSYRGTTTSSSGSPKNVGLWSYYPGRGNWNRE